MPQEWPFLKCCITHIRIENDEKIQNILVIIQIMATISPSTAASQCEFSAMNKKKTSLHTSLKDDRLDDIL